MDTAEIEATDTSPDSQRIRRKALYGLPHGLCLRQGAQRVH